MKVRIWLRRKLKRDDWSCGLARLANGMIVVVECWADSSTPRVVGSRPKDFNKPDGAMEFIRLDPGERDQIVKDLYVACCEELDIEPQ